MRGAPRAIAGRARALARAMSEGGARVRARLPVAPPRVRRVAGRLFPGERRVWGSALLVLLVTLPFLGYAVLRQRPYYTSTDSIGLVGLYFGVTEHQQICVPQVEIGAGTGQVEWAYATQNGPRPPISVTVRDEGGRLLASGKIGQGPVAGLAFVSVPISPVIAPSPAFRLATVCLRLGRGAPTQFGGMANTASDQAPVTIAGVPQGTNRVGLWFLPPARHATRSLLAQWSGLMNKLAVFRPAFFGAWFYWLLFLAGLPLLSFFGLRLLAVAEEPRRRLVLGLALIAFAGNAAWAVTTAAFDTPDESEHYAYVESLAETGRAPISTYSPSPPAYASDETLALAATRHFAQVTGSFGHPPWAPQEYARYKQELASQRPSRADGGGFSVATNAHSPLYYSLLVPGYELGRSGGTFVELFWMRLTSALLGVVVPLCAFGVLRELAPSRRRLAVAGGLLVAFEPMFTFISGAVNNDVGVNATAALAVYLAIRILRRGLTPITGVAFGIATALLPLMKGTGYALYPAIALAVIAIAARIRTRRGLRDIVVGAAALVAVQLVWQSIAASFGRAAVTIPGGANGGATAVTTGFASKLIYLWEVFFPRLPFMHPHWNPGQWPFFDIYVQRGIGGLGWYSIYFSTWVYDVVLWVVVAAGALALIAAWRRWPAVRARWRELIFLMLVIAGVIGGVEYEFYSVTPRPVLAEQGRYAFTALVPLAALAVAGLFALPKRWATTIVTMIVTAMIVLAFASRILYLTFTYVTS